MANTGDNSIYSNKLKEDEQSVSLKINFITLEGEELTINIPDLEDDPIFTLMTFAVEQRINDLALIEVLRRKVKREIMRIKGNYTKKGVAEKRKVNGDITPAMSTSTIQSIYKQPQDTFQDYMFAKKNSFPAVAPKPATPKGTKDQHKPAKTTANTLAGLKNVFDSKRKSEAVLPTKNLTVLTRDSDMFSKTSKSPPVQRSPNSPDLTNDSTSKQETFQTAEKQKRPDVQVMSRRLNSPGTSFVISPAQGKLSGQTTGDSGVPEVSYTLNIKKKTAPTEPPKPLSPTPAPEKPREHAEAIQAIFGILDSNKSGLLTGSSLDMGALMDTSIDLLDAMQDVITDIFDSQGVDMQAFAKLVESHCDLKRLAEVYTRAKLKK